MNTWRNMTKLRKDMSNKEQIDFILANDISPDWHLLGELMRAEKW